MAKPHLAVTQILAWADTYHARTRSWPKSCDGSIPHAHGETWSKLDSALRVGARGLPAGSSLSRLLAQRRGVRCYSRMPRQWDVQQILTWADAYHPRLGGWPGSTSGKIAGTQGAQWWQVDRALREGVHGLPGGSSLARLLEEQRQVPRYSKKHRPLTEEQILAWADAYHARTEVDARN